MVENRNFPPFFSFTKLLFPQYIENFTIISDHQLLFKTIMVDESCESLEKAIKSPPLLFAVQNGFEAMVESLISKRIDLNQTDDQQWTALHLAVKENNRIIIRKLIESKIDVNLRTNSGETALLMAVCNSNEKENEQKCFLFLTLVFFSQKLQDYQKS